MYFCSGLKSLAVCPIKIRQHTALLINLQLHQDLVKHAQYDDA